ncbi:DUF3168 domain-containing protein [Candidimonas humi]|uniref:DUF3168 domain-containing protein n=1 Tax=Candidimonas humi TaxID=683355 RepID=A0ABV8NXR5_9BURK|nr:DUF3168 domain-containing protein [Candidimonas humi]MBV6304936.1 DUF3168 domain-containing protein [Candidimonas humi]
MSIEAAIFSLLGPLVSNRCYPDTTPDAPVFPLIVYQIVGGQAYEYLARKLPDCENYRVQVWCWWKDEDGVAVRDEVGALALQVRQKIIEQGAAFVSAQTIGQGISQYEEALKLYGIQQDYSVWLKVR